MRCALTGAVLALAFLLGPARAADRLAVETRIVAFTPAATEDRIPERYRLGPHRFEAVLVRQYELEDAGFSVHHLRFPSPIETDCVENNTVHGEYHRPRGPGPFPAVILLDITAGDMRVPRLMARYLARHGVAALCVPMAWYGERRPPGSDRRLLSPDYPRTVAAIRQTVLDLRRATAWLAAQPDVDADRLGIAGTSLGSFIGTLTAEMEPRLKRVAVFLGGGGLVEVFYDDPRAVPLRRAWEAVGGTRASLVEALAPVDPITCAANIRDRRVLILAGRYDDVVPPKAAEALWRATGEQQLLWFDCDHLGAVFYLAPALDALLAHFAAE